MIDQAARYTKTLYLTLGATVITGLYFVSHYSYPLFHALVEIFSIVVACGIFIIAWNTRSIINNNYFLLFGVSSLCVGVIDLFHTFAYKGMNVFPGYGANLATQLWIAGRYLQSFALIAAPVFLGRKLRGGLVLALLLFTTALLLAAVFGGLFPVCFVEGSGLTPFKKTSEYVIALMLAGALYFMRRKSECFEHQVLRLLSGAIALFIAAELAFTIYTDVYGITNMVGHFFKLAGFFLVYKALIETGLVKPYALLFREIKQSEERLQAANLRLQDANEELGTQSEELQAQSEELQAQNEELAGLWEKSRLTEAALQKAHDELELRVSERTLELETAVDVLQVEIAERRMAEDRLQRINRLYAVLSETNHTIVRVKNRDELFSEFCRIAVKHGGFLLAWIGLVDEASGKIQTAAANGRTAYLDDIRITATEGPAGEGPTGLTVRTGTYCISNDFQHDPRTGPWHERGKAHGFNASASVALKEAGRVVGALTLYSGDKDYFDRQHVDLMLQMGLDISYALDNFDRETSRLNMESALLLETAERLQTVEALREKEQLLVQQSRQAAMGEMIGNIAHQWRQPLNTLGLMAQKLGVFYGSPDFNKIFLDDSVAKTMEIIKHMSKTIDDFSNYFKPEKEKTDFYVGEAINNTLSLMDGSFQSPKISVDIIEHDNPVVNGYQNEFSQVFLNLLNNARDAIIERAVDDAQVIITMGSEAGWAFVTVADNAGGISEEIIGKVFDPYFTTKGPQQGSGVGLFMSKSIIEKNMGGRLAVRNTCTGAEFRIELEVGSPN